MLLKTASARGRDTINENDLRADQSAAIRSAASATSTRRARNCSKAGAEKISANSIS
jgi:hypothetical protein